MSLLKILSRNERVFTLIIMYFVQFYFHMSFSVRI
jgi:hypothetical protein